jgi:signal transduction histidine kinase
MMNAIGHDLSNLLSSMTVGLKDAPNYPDEELLRLIDDVGQAASSAAKLLEAVRGRNAAVAQGGLRSTETVARLGISLIRPEYPHFQFMMTGDFDHGGTTEDALRIVQNLLFNAVREAKSIGGKSMIMIKVHVDDRSLRITNMVRDPALLDERIWQLGTSHHDSSGVGLASVREVAAQIGWSVRHEVVGNEVTFIVEPDSRAGYR